jgi:hypothetical protein
MDILLQEREVIDLDRIPEKLSLKCLTGLIWVTCQGDRQDYLLKPGMEYRNSKRGKVVACALTESSLCIFNIATSRQEVPVGQLLQV